MSLPQIDSVAIPPKETNVSEPAKKELITGRKAIGSTSLRDSGTEITLLTNTGYFLWTGRNKSDRYNSVMGTKSALMYCSRVEQSAMADDPWADKVAHEMEMALENAFQHVDYWLHHFTELSKPKYPDMVSHDPVPDSPPTVLAFVTPFLGSQLLELMKGCDLVVHKVLTCQHRGKLTSNQKYAHLREVERFYRSVVYIPLRFQATGVTRDDVAKMTQLAAKATSLMGECPPEYLSGELYSKYVTRPERFRKKARQPTAVSSQQSGSSSQDMP